MRIDIIGAGPIGGHAAYLLAKRGHDVHLYEDHDEIGKPIQCTGLMTVSLGDILSPRKEFLVNTTERVDVHAPDGSTFAIKTKEYIVDRSLFDTYLVNKAVDAGAQLHKNHRFTSIENGDLLFKTPDGIKKTKKEILIGADGATSTVANTINPNRPRKYCVGIQARVRGSFDPMTYSVFFNNEISPGFFAWIVPESETIARVGLKGTNKNFAAFLDRLNCTKLEMQSGPIPIYDPCYVTEHDNIYLIGDAATHVKATTAGGLIPGLKAAQCLADALEHSDSYEKRWKKTIGRDLWLHLKIRNVLDKFTDNDWNRFIALISQERVKSVFERYDREKPFKLLTAIIKEPRLLLFGKYLIH